MDERVENTLLSSLLVMQMKTDEPKCNNFVIINIRLVKSIKFFLPQALNLACIDKVIA